MHIEREIKNVITKMFRVLNFLSSIVIIELIIINKKIK